MKTIHKDEQWLKHDGINISYNHYSSSTKANPALVLVHGFLSSKFCFRFMIPELIEHFDIFVFDYPPFGDSDKVCKYDFSYRNFARIIIQLLDQHQISTASIGGHSMGGQVALVTAHLYPDRIDKLILFAPSTYVKKSNPFLRMASKTPAFWYILKRYFYRKGVYGTLSNCVYDPNIVDKDMIQGYMRPFLKRDIFHCLTKMIRDREGDLPSEHLQTIRAECLVLWGEEDKVLPISLGYKLIKDLPSAKLVTYKNIGHLLPEEIPLTLSEQTKQFCTLKTKTQTTCLAKTEPHESGKATV